MQQLPMRNGVGVIVLNNENKVFVGKRKDNPVDRWQMPQGGVDIGESYLSAMKRELYEETSIKSIKILKEIDGFFEYELPEELIGIIWKGKFRGQRQKWFITRFIGNENEINLQTKNPEFIEVHRLCKFNPRATDVDVILDLMIHDIDIVLSLINHEIKKISVSGKKVITELIDIANVRIEFKNNVVANLTASRISTKNERKMRIFLKNSYYSVDFINNELKKLKKTKNNTFKHVDYKFKKSDSLRDEINNFIKACNGKEKSMTTGFEGQKALAVAKKITRNL